MSSPVQALPEAGLSKKQPAGRLICDNVDMCTAQQPPLTCHHRLDAMCTPLQLLKSKIRRDFLRLLEIGLDKGPGPSLVPRRLGGTSRSLTGRLAQILRRGGTPGVENPNPQRLAVY